MVANEERATPWGMVVLLAAMTVLGPLSIAICLPALPSIATALSASMGQAQATVSAFLLGMGVGQLFYGPASDRLGRRGPLLLGGVLYVAASFACIFATSPEMMIASRFVQALGACAGGVIGRAIVRDQFGHVETARMLSLMALLTGLAPVFAPMLGGLLLGLGGWTLDFIFMGVAGLVVLLATVMTLKETRSAETTAHSKTEGPVRAYLMLLRERRVAGYVLAGALNGAGLFTFIATSPDLLINTYHMTPAQYGGVFIFIGMALLGGNYFNRILLRRFGPDHILRGASCVAVLIAILMVVVAVTEVAAPWSLIGLLFLLQGSYSFMQGNSMAGALSVDPRRAGSTSALMGFSSFAAGAVGSAVSGALHDGTARPMALVTLVVTVGAAVSLWVLAPPKRARSPA
ncbi:multidrug effflux MFS transporter [Phenylobacterium immobile]|uniref:multidrug effflux MFS transporter n=1 Tax=Phenylobacterium immobile TaxID=21 RepID=UPI000A89934D|nr:multidrug effflux MFS transporter [Phenylobacterium immobile]